jgi:hypothetical protein
METGNWTLRLPIPSFEFPVSNFEFPVSNFQSPVGVKCCKLFDHGPPELLYWRKTFVKFESK